MTPRAAAFTDDQAAAEAPGLVDATTAIADAAARLVNASLDMERRREAERQERTQRYRAAVAKAADNGGALTEAEIEQLMADCRALDFPAEAFSQDLSATWRDREQDQKITAARGRGREASQRYATAAAEEKSARDKFSAARGELDSLVKQYDREVVAIGKRMREAEREATLANREASGIEDKQHLERSRHPRLWG